MSGMWATPVIRVNYSGISGEGQESNLDLSFPKAIWKTTMPQLRTFPSCSLYSHFRPQTVIPEAAVYVSKAA